MRKLPPPSEWISLKEAARILGNTRSGVYRARRSGRKDADGQRRYLRCWQTIGKGIVTTEEECELFLNYMSGWK